MAKKIDTMSSAVKELEKLYDILNVEYFDGKLTRPIITVMASAKQGLFGYYMPRKVWQTDEERLSELNITAETVGGDVYELVDTMLHEMVHQYNDVNGIKDCSRGGTYHNKKFKESAERVGLIVECDKKSGFHLTSLSPANIEFVNVKKIQRISINRDFVGKLTGGSSKSSTRKYYCPMCDMSVRATKKVAIMCIECECRMECDEE